MLARSVRGAAADDFGMVANSIAFAAFLSILPLLSVVALTYGALVPKWSSTMSQRLHGYRSLKLLVTGTGGSTRM